MVTRQLFSFNFRLNRVLVNNFNLTSKNISVMNKITPKQSGTAVTKVKPSAQVLENEKSLTAPAETTAKFEVLPTPVKSQSDKKEYKVIRLENGLTACLISDMAKVTDLNSILSADSESESEDESDDDPTSSEAESVKSASQDEGEDGDEHKIQKVHNEVKLAAAALCIGVGSFSDPKEVPGLAHFLEHMVFMGSKKFPQENDFDAFIKKHGGSDNASTDYEETTFYFECFDKHLAQGLDKFSQFFIAPLMKRDSLTREREAVESEFQLAVPSDDYRKEQMLVGLAERSSPVNSFSWGNLVTLRDNISEDKLYEALHEFRKRHYSAHRMTLAVQARLPMDMLESYVVGSFSDIANNGLPPDDFTKFSESIFETPHFRRLYYVKPVKDICQIDLTWIMPPLLNKYRSKPHVYVSWLLGHEGKGSLLSYLKKKVWALSLYAGNGESGAEYNSIYASFSVNIILTKSGFDHLQEVIEAVFSFIKLMKKVGPNEGSFKEMQSIAETSFRFEEDETASDKVEDLAEAMRYYPSEDYLTGSELFFEYNPEEITKVLNYLVPDKMNVMVLSSSVPDHIVYDKVEPWFKTQYADIEIPEDWMKKWLSAKPLSDFNVPESNPFLTNDFSLLPVQENVPQYPEKILDTSMIELWYRKDQKFELPTAYYYYYLISPYSMDSAKSACLIQMYVGLVGINLAEEGYPARLADLSYSISPCEKGISIKISGYNEKLPILVDLVAKYLKDAHDHLSEAVFQAMRDKQKRGIYNTILKPSKLCKDLRLSILQNKYYSLIERYVAISGITFEDVERFSKDFLGNLYVQGLVQGNVSRDTALETTESLLKRFDCRPLSPQDRPKIFINEIPKGERCCRVASFNESNANSTITNYYQCGMFTVKENVILEFIMLLIEEPLFDILRTKEQLGYNVYCTIRDTYGMLGFSITVNTQADKYTPQHVDARIEAFLKHTHKLLKRLNDKKFNQTRNDLIKIKQCIDVDLEDEVDRNWDEIVNHRYMFDRLQQEIEAIEELKVGEVRKWWISHNVHGKNEGFQKLTMQIVGHGSKTGKHEKGTKLEVTTLDMDMKEIEQFIDTKLDVDATVESGEATDNITVGHLDVQQTAIKISKVVPCVGVDSLANSPDKSEAKSALASPSVIANSEELSLRLLTDPNKSKDYFITNIEEFKRGLKTYPEQSN